MSIEAQLEAQRQRDRAEAPAGEGEGVVSSHQHPPQVIPGML